MWFTLCLSVFLLLYGMMNVTNVEIVWMKPICGLAALIAGVIGVVLFCMQVGPAFLH